MLLTNFCRAIRNATISVFPLATAAGALTLTVLILAAPADAQQDVLPNIPSGTISISLQTIATGLGAPDYAISEPGDTNRLFVVDQNGLIRVIQNGSLLPTPALDLRSLIVGASSSSDERGLLGLAFTPDFNTPSSPGYHTLYTYNSQANGTAPTYAVPNGASQSYKNVLNEFKLSGTNSNVFDPTSRREVISFGKNASNHNGGTATFGPDGYLYLGTGDGGDGNDVGPSHVTGGNGQSLAVALGKMLRIDPINPTLTTGSTNAVSSNGQYRIPGDNPFAAGQVPEIYAYGFRNPYRFSFDTANGQLIVGDVGQNTVEEVDRVVRGGNFGWAVKEGDFPFDRTAGTVGTRSPGVPAGLIDPISGAAGTVEYDHGDGEAVIGGFVYRGTADPELAGKYVFGDELGRLFYADLTTGQLNTFVLPNSSAGNLPGGLSLHGFGQDNSGNLFVLATSSAPSGTGGGVFEIIHTPATLVWSGSVNGTWDIYTTTNFNGNTSHKFINTDKVTFDSTGANRTITISAGGVSPGSVVFSNTAGKNYSISGGPIAGTTSLSVSGGGLVLLSSTNTYTGGTFVSSGTLEITNVHGLADGSSLTIGNALKFPTPAVPSLADPVDMAQQGSTTTSVPEPSAVVLLATGVMCLLARAWPQGRRLTDVLHKHFLPH
jgi:autotransporter-associated beta strand protein